MTTTNKQLGMSGFLSLLLFISLFNLSSAYAAPFAYISNYSDNTVSVIDTVSNAVVGLPITVGTHPTTVAVHPAGTFVYVSNWDSHNISVIATANNSIVSTIKVGASPRGIAVHPAGTFVYVANYDSNDVSVIDTGDNTVVQTIPVAAGPRGIAVNPAGTRVYVANTGSNYVSVIDTDSLTVVKSILVKTYPIGVALNPSGTRIYVTNYSSNNISVIDAATNIVVGSPIAVGSHPVGVTFDPSGARAYVANYSGNTVSVIDTATRIVVATPAVGTSPVGVAVNPSGAYLYVVNNGSKNVSVIDTSNNTVANTITVGNSPASMGLFIGPEAVNGTCGADNLQTLSTQPGNLCTSGSPTGVTPGTTSYTWSCQGNGIGITANCSANRIYAISTRVNGGNGIISANRYVPFNTTTSLTVTPAPGYLPGPVIGTCGGTLVGNNYTTTAVTADCSVIATFAAGATTPNTFSFNPQTGIAPNSIITSNTITVAGISAPAAPIAIASGMYSINGGAYTSMTGTILNGDTVTLQQTSSASASMMTTATLTIGGITGDFWVTTSAAGCLLNPVWITGSASYYTLIQNAFDHAANDDVVEINAYSFGENLLLNSDNNVTLKGGFDCAYSNNTNQFTTIRTLTVRGTGKIIAENLIIGGSGSDAAIAMSSSPGMITLPLGSTILPNDLVVSSAVGDVAVRADGGFRVTEPIGSGPATVTATDSNGKLVMLGHVDADHPERNGISPASTAQELLFLSTMSFILPREQWPQVYEILAAAPETAIVAGVIAARIAVNATAVADRDPVIQAAIAEATTSLLAVPASSAKTQSLALAAKVSSASQISSAAPGGLNTVSVNISTTPDPYGLSLHASLDDLGVYIENTCRIHRRYFVYRTGYIPETSNFTDPPTPLDNWIPVSDGFLSAVTGVTGVISSLSDFFIGNKIAWAPKDTPSISLPVVPITAKGSSFKVYVVGAGSADYLLPPADLVNQPDALAAVSKAARDVALLELFKEFILPLLTKVMPNIAQLANPELVLTLAQKLSAELLNKGFNVDFYLEKGDYKGAVSGLLQLLISVPSVKDELFKVLYQWVQSVEVAATGLYGPSGWTRNLENVCVLIKGVDVLLGLTDLKSAAYQIGKSNMYNSWDAASINVTVKLNPVIANISPTLPHVDFTVRAMGVPGTSLPLKYKWYGPYKGAFDDHNWNTGNDIWSDKSIVTYTATAPVPISGTDTISVDVYDIHNSLIKTVSATVQFTDNPFIGKWTGMWPNDETENANVQFYISCNLVSPNNSNVIFCSVLPTWFEYDGGWSISGFYATSAVTSFTSTTIEGGYPYKFTGEIQSDGSLVVSFPNGVAYDLYGEGAHLTGKPCAATFVRRP